MMTRIFVILITATSLMGCNRTTTGDSAQSNSVNMTTVENVQSTVRDNGDTLLVKGPFIVFFMPTNDEKAEITNIDGEYVEVISDFEYYAQTVIDSLKKSTQIRTDVTTKRVITMVLNNGESYSFNRTDGEGDVGVLFSDGKQTPKISYGVATDLDYWEMIGDFYHR